MEPAPRLAGVAPRGQYGGRPADGRSAAAERSLTAGDFDVIRLG